MGGDVCLLYEPVPRPPRLPGASGRRLHHPAARPSPALGRLARGRLKTVFRLLGRWLVRTLAVALVFFVTLYLGDWAVFTVHGSPVSKARVNRFLSVPLKGNKTEYDFVGTFDVPCSVSLFAQGGQSPCWWLAHHPDQWK